MKINPKNMNKPLRSPRPGSLNPGLSGLALLLLSTAALSAATSTWNGGSATGAYWSDAANWGGTAEASGNALTFGGTARQTNTNDLTALNVGIINMSSVGWNITGNAVTNTSGIMTNNVTGTATWGLNTTLNAGIALSQSGTGDILNFTGVLSGTGGFAKAAGAAGQGAAYLVNTNNSFTGQVNDRTGNLYFYSLAPGGQNSSLGAGTSDILIGYGSTSYAAGLTYLGTNNGVTDRNLSFANSSTANIVFNNSSPNNSSLAFNGTVNKFPGPGLFTAAFGGTSTGTNVFNGTLGASYFGAAMSITGPGTWAFNNLIYLTGTLKVTNTAHVVLGYNATYPYSTVLFPTMTFNSGATLDVSSYDTNGSAFVLGEYASYGYPQTLIAGRTNGAATDINGSLSLAATAAGGATLKVAGASIPGTLTISSNFIPASGTIALDLATNTTIGLQTNDLILVGGNLDLSQGTAIVAVNALKGSVLTNTPYTIISYSGSLIGSAAGLSVSSPSRAYLPGTVSTATPGLVQVTFYPSGQNNASLVWQGNNGANWDVDTTANWLNGASSDYFFGGDNVVFNDTASTFGINLVGSVTPLTMTVSNNVNNYTIATSGGGSIGSGSLVKQGAAELTVSSANLYSGGTVISGGTVSAGNATALGSGGVTLGDANTKTGDVGLLLSGGITLANAVNLTANGTGAALIGLESGGNATISGPITLQRNLILTNSSTTAQLLVNGGITGTGNVTVTGGGNFPTGGYVKWNTGAANFTGNINITGAGTMLDINVAVSTNVNLFVDAGAYLGDVNSPTINSLTGSGTIEPGPGAAYATTLYIGSAGGSGTFNGTFTNNALGYSCNIVMNGNGTETLTGDNSLSGGVTTVSVGTLIVANTTGYGLGTGNVNISSNATLVIDNSGGYGSGNGVISVAATGTLCGTGSVYSATHTLQVSGTLAVGNPGHTAATSFTVTNSGITFNSGSTLSVALFTGAGAGDNTATASAADILNAQATVTINTNATLTVTNPNNLTGWHIGDAWKIISWNTAPTNAFANLNLPALPGTMMWSVTNLYTTGVIAVVANVPTDPTLPASILGVTVTSDGIVFNGTNRNGGSSFHYAVLTSTNLSIPLTNWTVLSTNSFNADGTFRYTNAINPAKPAAFFNVKAVQ